MRHVRYQILNFGCNHRRSTEENEMVHKQFKLFTAIQTNTLKILLHNCLQLGSTRQNTNSDSDTDSDGNEEGTDNCFNEEIESTWYSSVWKAYAAVENLFRTVPPMQVVAVF